MAITRAPDYAEVNTAPAPRASAWDGPHLECKFYFERQLRETAQSFMDMINDLNPAECGEALIDPTLGETRCPSCGVIIRLERALALGRWVVYGRDGRQHWCEGAPVAPSEIEVADRCRQVRGEV